MLRFGANLGPGMLFSEYPFLERFDRAAAAGFGAVEYPQPYGEDIRAIRDALRRTGLEQAQFNLPWGDVAGQRGTTNDPDRRAAFRDDVARALDIAVQLGCPRVLVHAGVALPDVPGDVQWGTIVENVRYAAEQAQAPGVRILIEPLNPYDVPGYLLTTTAQALRLLGEAGHPNTAILYDVYHAQRAEGNLVATLREHLGRIGHIELADSPDRHQPGTGEINVAFLLGELDAAGFGGWICPEYRPLGGTEASLAWLREWLPRA
jgi:hydroxypyruvate isomerase